MDTVLRAGIALCNAQWFHAAHDAWEERWLSLPNGSPDEQLLHGLIQYSAAIHHATRANHTGAIGLATSASEYLGGIAPSYRRVSLTPIRLFLAAIRVDPTIVFRAQVPPILLAGTAVQFADLSTIELRMVARIMAHERAEFNATRIEQAVAFSKHGVDSDRFDALVRDFVCDRQHRRIVYQRLKHHVERESAKNADVTDLFSTDQST